MNAKIVLKLWNHVLSIHLHVLLLKYFVMWSAPDSVGFRMKCDLSNVIVDPNNTCLNQIIGSAH